VPEIPDSIRNEDANVDAIPFSCPTRVAPKRGFKVFIRGVLVSPSTKLSVIVLGTTCPQGEPLLV
jgi:hypothetical protein